MFQLLVFLMILNCIGETRILRIPRTISEEDNPFPYKIESVRIDDAIDQSSNIFDFPNDEISPENLEDEEKSKKLSLIKRHQKEFNVKKKKKSQKNHDDDDDKEKNNYTLPTIENVESKIPVVALLVGVNVCLGIVIVVGIVLIKFRRKKQSLYSPSSSDIYEDQNAPWLSRISSRKTTQKENPDSPQQKGIHGIIKKGYPPYYSSISDTELKINSNMKNNNEESSQDESDEKELETKKHKTNKKRTRRSNQNKERVRKKSPVKYHRIAEKRPLITHKSKHLKLENNYYTSDEETDTEENNSDSTTLQEVLERSKREYEYLNSHKHINEKASSPILLSHTIAKSIQTSPLPNNYEISTISKEESKSFRTKTSGRYHNEENLQNIDTEENNQANKECPTMRESYSKSKTSAQKGKTSICHVVLPKEFRPIAGQNILVSLKIPEYDEHHHNLKGHKKEEMRRAQYSISSTKSKHTSSSKRYEPVMKAMIDTS